MKKKTLQKTIGVVLSTAMVLGMMTGCGSTDAPTESSSEQESSTTGEESSAAPESEAVYEYETGFNVTLSGSQGATEDWDNTYVIALLEEKFGVTIDAVPVQDDVWDTRWNLMMAEDEVPDILTCTWDTLAEISQWGADGYLLPINEYLDHMPNLTAFFEANPDYLAACTSPDGNIYGLATYSGNVYNNVTRTWINEEWLNNVGKEYPTTLDELYDVLVAFRDNDANGNGDPNDEVPFAWTENYSRKALTNILNAFGIVTEQNTSNCFGILEVSDEGQVYLADATENYKAFLTYMNKLWEEGLCLNTAYTSTNAEVQAMAKENILGVYSYASPIAMADETNACLRYEYLGALTSEYQKEPIIGASPFASNTMKLMLSADTEHPEEICRIIDFFFSDEGIYAAKNVMYYAENYEEIGSKYYYDMENPITIEGLEEYPQYMIAEECNTMVPEGYESWADFNKQKLYINEGFNMVAYIDPNSLAAILPEVGASDEICDNCVEANMSAWTALIHKRINDSGEAQIVFGYPTMVYDASVIEERNSLYTDISLYCQTAQAQFITGEMDIEKDWDTYLESLNKMNVDRLIEIEQESYDALYK